MYIRVESRLIRIVVTYDCVDIPRFLTIHTALHPSLLLSLPSSVPSSPLSPPALASLPLPLFLLPFLPLLPHPLFPQLFNADVMMNLSSAVAVGTDGPAQSRRVRERATQREKYLMMAA